jgi:site-specific DNA-methyltransferase (adenine-specific)
MSENLSSHPFADLIPSMTEEEYQGLKADIAEHGQREAIVLYEGKILDGRHRYSACCELGLVPKFTQWDGHGSLVAFVASVNVHRRHLTAGQRAALAAALEAELAIETKRHQREAIKERDDNGRATSRPVVERIPQVDSSRDDSGVGPLVERIPQVADAEQLTTSQALMARLPQVDRPTKARDQAAALVGANPRYVQDAKTVQREAPDLFQQVHDGKMTLPQAMLQIRNRQKLAELQRKAAAAQSTADGPPLWNIHQGDCLEVLPTLTGVARVIFTDPPYNLGIDYGAGAEADNLPPDQYLAWCREWIQRCADCLTPDGSLWILISDEWADYFGIMLREAGLHRRAWIKWYETFGTNCVNNFNRCSRHLFYTVKNPRCFVFDPFAVSRPSDRQTKYGDKRANPGGKIWDDVWKIARLTGTCEERMPGFPTQVPLAITRAIVKCASEPGDLVVDPFSGSASTGVAAVEGQRRYVGIEASAEFCRLSELRLQALGQA